MYFYPVLSTNTPQMQLLLLLANVIVAQVLHAFAIHQYIIEPIEYALRVFIKNRWHLGGECKGLKSAFCQTMGP